MSGTEHHDSRPSGDRAETGADPALSAELRKHLGLSRIESLVACALAEGLTYQEIADSRRISYHTVHSHVKAIHRKAGVSSNARLIALIRKEGWR
jgi:DNA-binding NarL/FixJ family response regulator